MFEGSSVLLDVLAIVIAFAAVMLLLSLLVTSLAQATQAALRLRARNLQSGLASILDPEFKSGARALAASLLNSVEVSVLRRRKDPTSWFSRLRGPFVSWVEPQRLREALTKEVGDKSEPSAKEEKADEEPATSAVDVDATVERFRRLDAPLKKRFALAMRMISVSWALIVALVFQVSTPMLLERLSTDPEYRERLAGRAEEILEYGGEALGRLEVGDASETALERLMERHPELRGEVEEATSEEVFPEAAAEDLAEFLEQSPDRESLVEEYKSLLTEELEERREVAVAEAREATSQLAAIDITPWRYGGRFYWDRGLKLANLLGVLVTAILLTLGAPFWFNTLKQAVALRDLLSPRKNEDDADSEESSNDDTGDDQPPDRGSRSGEQEEEP